jgi:integrase
MPPVEVARVSQMVRVTYAAWDRALYVLGVNTGFRLSELLSLRVGDVLLDCWQQLWDTSSRGAVGGATGVTRFTYEQGRILEIYPTGHLRVQMDDGTTRSDTAMRPNNDSLP